jgi:hypothetical protein
MRKHHHAAATALDAVAEAEDPDLHTTTSHHDTTTALDTGEEAGDPSHQGMQMKMKARKSRWGCHALPIGFVERQYPKDSNYPMINISTIDHKSPSRGYHIIFGL